METMYIDKQPIHHEPDEDTKDLTPYFKAYSTFIRRYLNPYYPKLKLIAQELMVSNVNIGVIGTVDRIYQDIETGKLILLDIKTGSEQNGHWLQQMTYKELLATQGIIIDDIWLLSLKGHMSIVKWSLKSDKFQKFIMDEIKNLKKIHNLSNSGV